MRSYVRTGMIVASAIALSSGSAFAQTNQVGFQGNTTGCFSSLDVCDPTAESFYGDNILQFTGGAFNATTQNGALEFDGSTNHSLGYFSWLNFEGARSYLSPFTLAINLITPTGVDPAPVYGGYSGGIVVQGQVDWSLSGVIFRPSERTYTFATGNGDQRGSFTMELDDLYLQAQGRTYLTGRITNATTGSPSTVTPEPVSMALMGTGLAGLAAARRRRKKEAELV
jgi:hypothetical protein